MDLALGIVGTGTRGAGMWRRLQSQGRGAAVFDVATPATEPLVAAGATAAADPAGLAAGADLVILSLPRSSDVEAVVHGPKGLLAGLRPDAIVVDTTSGEPSVSAALAATADVVILSLPRSCDVEAVVRGP
jgi:3-hydroxyisobutyrate dehydrogenase